MKIFRILALLMVVLTVISCSDDEQPRIIITAPLAGSTVGGGWTINLIAIVTDNQELDSISFIHGIVEEEVLEFNSPTQHAINYTFIVDNTMPPGPLPITVSAVDMEGNKATNTVTIQVQ